MINVRTQTQTRKVVGKWIGDNQKQLDQQGWTAQKIVYRDDTQLDPWKQQEFTHEKTDRLRAVNQGTSPFCSEW